MAERYKVIVKVVSQKGICEAEHKVGDEWIFDNDRTPQGICLGVAGTLIDNVRVLEWGGSFGWEKDPDKNYLSCPDPENPVVFELRRIRE